MINFNAGVRHQPIRFGDDNPVTDAETRGRKLAERLNNNAGFRAGYLSRGRMDSLVTAESFQEMLGWLISIEEAYPFMNEEAQQLAGGLIGARAAIQAQFMMQDPDKLEFITEDEYERRTGHYPWPPQPPLD